MANNLSSLRQATPRQRQRTWDSVLLELIEDLEHLRDTIEGSHDAKLWIRTGLRMAIQEVKEHRIELIVTGTRPR